MNQTSRLLLLAALLGVGAAARADILELRNGNLLNGKYAGGTASTINYQTSNGLMTIETAQVVALTMTAPASQTPPPAPAASSGPVTLPAGTLLLVRMMDSVSSRDSAGANFTTKLEYDLV